MSELPPPLVDAGTNLRNFSFIPIEITRLQRSRAWLTAKRNPELAFYMLNLWMAAWHEVPAGSLEDDDDVLAEAAMCGRRKWPHRRTEVLRNWIKCSDDRLYHPVVCEKVAVAWDAARRYQAKLDRRLSMESGEWEAIRAQVFARDDFTCRYCGARGARLECDHVVPVSRGGKTALNNLATACFPCNRSKGALLLEEWRQQ